MSEKVGKKVGVSVFSDMVKLEIMCGDVYAAQVLYDDLVERLRAGESITISLENPTPAPPELD